LPELIYYKHPEAKGPFYTSGTSGKPKEIWLNPDDEKRITVQGSKLYSLTFKRDDRILNCFPKQPAVSGYMSNLGLSAEKYNFQHFPAQEIKENPQRFTEVLKKFNPTVIMSLTTFAYRLPLLFTSLGLERKFSTLQRALVSAEPSTISRRKTISQELNVDVYDLYASSENGVIAYEVKPLTDEHIVNQEDTLIFLVREKDEVSISETGDVLLTNLFDINLSEPYMVLLNYKIGDRAKCVEKEDSEIVTSISEIRRESAYLAGAKLNPQEVEKAIEELEDYKKELTGEYFIVTYSDSQRRAIAEVRIEGRKNLSLEDEKNIDKRIRERIYSANFPVWNEVENTKNARLLIEVTNPGELYKGYEQYIKPGKPKRLLVLTDV